MKLFSCPHCGRRLFFENALCLACGSAVLYHPREASFVLAAPGMACANATECDCNWTAEEGDAFCLACALNRTIPDLSVDKNLERWAAVEKAKKRTVYSLLAFGLEVRPKAALDEDAGIAFDFLADRPGAGPGGERILTGHDNGVITLNVAEADSAEREAMRVAMGERYRTLLGHFRHELGHYYWDRLIRDAPARLDRFRALFGDERTDYARALVDHYAAGSPVGWQRRHISAYAASHPWEDWAETWAHYLHIMDTLEMAEAYGIPAGAADTVAPSGDAVRHAAFDALLERWLALSQAANSINRCMGLPDLYPFVIAGAVTEKLHFVDRLLRGGGEAEAAA